MSVLGNSLLLGAEAAGPTAYQVSRSLRFNSADSAYLSRTPGSAGNQKTYTLSMWIKRSKLGQKYFFGSYFSNLSRYQYLGFNSSDQLEFFGGVYTTGGSTTTHVNLSTTAVYRDVSAWYHLVLAVDTTQATDTNRVKLYVNGTQITDFGTATYPAQNSESYINSVQAHYLGDWGGGGSISLDGYIADVYLLDGTATTPSTFAETDAITGQWVPKNYTGSKGTNGFNLNFSDNASTTTLGYDNEPLSAATGALPILNTSDDAGRVVDTGTRTDANAANLVLAVPMNGANNGTTFTDQSATIKGSGTAKAITRSGNTITSTAQSRYYGSSGYFDTVGDVLTVPAGADFAYGTGDFSLEAWIYPTQTVLKRLYAQSVSGINYFVVQRDSSGTISFTAALSGGGTAITTSETAPLNRWSHVAVTRESGTIRIFINGVQSASGTNTTNLTNTTYVPTIGAYTHNTADSWGGYISDFRIYKGVAKYTAAFTPSLVNDWTTNNFSVTAGAGNDSLVDTPTSYGTDTGAGGEVRGNYATFNPLNVQLGAGSLSNGNLDLTGPSGSSAYNYAGGTFGIDTSTSTGWYFEFTQTTYGQYASVALLDQSVSASSLNNLYAIGNSFANGTAGISYTNQGTLNNYGTTTTGLTSWTSNGDVIGVAIKDNKIWFAKNNTWISGSPSAGTSPSITLASTKYVTPAAIGINSSVLSLNAGQRPFAYTAPSGFKALVDTNLTAPVIAKPNEVMDVKLYTGNASTNAITGLGFSPDLVWIKSRSSANWHNVLDTVRGNLLILYTNDTRADSLETVASLTSFDSTGFTLSGNGDTGVNNVNGSGISYTAWTWDAGSSTVTNTQGSITSSVRANASAGFAVITGSTPSTNINFTFGHGLGVAPSLVIYKHTAVSGNWQTYHRSGGGNNYNLNSTAGPANSGTWSGLDPTSTLITIPSGIVSANSSAFVCYAFSPVAGYSAMGSYTGNGSADGPFVYTGHRSRWIMLKRTDTSGGWVLIDTARSTYNLAVTYLYADLSNAESTFDVLDINSNGFKLRNTFANWNASGGTYVFVSFAENPFQYARAR